MSEIDSTAGMSFDSLNVLADILGWGYFFSWALVCYPQIILNWKLQSVEGFKLDYPFLNLTGFIFFSIVYGCGFFLYPLKDDNYGLGEIEIEDLIFAFHGVFVCTILNLQAVFYKRGENKIHPLTIAFVVFAWLLCIFFYFATEKLGWIAITDKINILELLGDLKVFITSIKYAFLVFWNWKRQSTAGFSGVAFLFDLTGSILSLSNTLLLFHIGRTKVLNIPKLALAVVVVFYNLILLYQSFILYPKKRVSESLLLQPDGEYAKENIPYVKIVESSGDSSVNL